MKTNGAQHPKLKELFFPSCELPRDGSPLPDRVQLHALLPFSGLRIFLCLRLRNIGRL